MFFLEYQQLNILLSLLPAKNDGTFFYIKIFPLKIYNKLCFPNYLHPVKVSVTESSF